MKTSKNMRVCCLLALCSVCFCGCSFAQKTVVSKSVVCVSDYDANISSTELDKVWNSGYKYIFSMPDSARLVTYQTLCWFLSMDPRCISDAIRLSMLGLSIRSVDGMELCGGG